MDPAIKIWQQTTIQRLQTYRQPANVPFNVHVMPSQEGTTSQRNSQDPRLAQSSGCNCKNFPVYPNSGKVPSHSAANNSLYPPNSNKVFLNRNLSPSSETQREGTQRPQQTTGSTISIHPIISVQAATITQYRAQTQNPSTPLQQTHVRSAPVFNPPNQHSFLHRQTIGNFYIWSQTREFVNIINLSILLLISVFHPILSAMLFQFIQHQYESALAVFYSTFLFSILGLNYGYFPQQ
jgi:hypothetical protein